MLYDTILQSTTPHSIRLNFLLYLSLLYSSLPFPTLLYPSPTQLYSLLSALCSLFSVLYSLHSRLSTTLCSSTPHHSTPLHPTPLYSTLRFTRLYSTPLHSAPLDSTLRHSTPLYSICFRDRHFPASTPVKGHVCSSVRASGDFRPERASVLGRTWECQKRVADVQTCMYIWCSVAQPPPLPPHGHGLPAPPPPWCCGGGGAAAGGGDTSGGSSQTEDDVPPKKALYKSNRPGTRRQAISLAHLLWEHDFGHLEATMSGQLEARLKTRSGGSKLCSHREASTTLQDPPRRHCVNQIAQRQEVRAMGLAHLW